MASAQELIIYGYLRQILTVDKDYTFIIAIIVEFSKQGFARYFQESLHKEFMTEMKFGDIVRVSDDDIMVLNKENKLENIEYCQFGDNYCIYVSIHIPRSICNELNNAVSFYSKLNQNAKSLPPDDDDRNLEIDFLLELSHDDGFILEKLGGPLKSEYPSIHYHSDHGKFGYLSIEYDKHRVKTFTDLKDWNYKDIIKFHELRLDKNHLTKIHVEGEWLQKVEFVSNLWEYRRSNIFGHSQDYVGPKKEESAMIDKITDFYAKKMKAVQITIEVVREYDMEMYKEKECSDVDDDW